MMTICGSSDFWSPRAPGLYSAFQIMTRAALGAIRLTLQAGDKGCILLIQWVLTSVTLRLARHSFSPYALRNPRAHPARRVAIECRCARRSGTRAAVSAVVVVVGRRGRKRTDRRQMLLQAITLAIERSLTSISDYHLPLAVSANLLNTPSRLALIKPLN